MRYARKKDANQNEVTADLEKIGFSILDLSALGRAYPDFAMFRSGLAMLVELKAPKRKPTGRYMRDVAQSQLAFRETWEGCPAIEAASTEEILVAWRLHHSI